MENVLKTSYKEKAHNNKFPRARRSYTIDDLKAAVKAVKEDKLPLRVASMRYNVPRATLCDKIHDKTPIHQHLGPRRALPVSIEKELVRFCLNLKEKEIPFKISTLQNLVAKVLAIEGSKEKFKAEGLSDFKHDKPSHTWLTDFLKRNPQAQPEFYKKSLDPYLMDINEEVEETLNRINQLFKSDNTLQKSTNNNQEIQESCNKIINEENLRGFKIFEGFIPKMTVMKYNWHYDKCKDLQDDLYLVWKNYREFIYGKRENISNTQVCDNNDNNNIEVADLTPLNIPYSATISESIDNNYAFESLNEANINQHITTDVSIPRIDTEPPQLNDNFNQTNNYPAFTNTTGGLTGINYTNAEFNITNHIEQMVILDSNDDRILQMNNNFVDDYTKQFECFEQFIPPDKLMYFKHCYDNNLPDHGDLYNVWKNYRIFVCKSNNFFASFGTS